MRSRKSFARVLTGFGLALVFSSTLVATPAPPALADGPVKVLIVGDSITSGVNGDYTWRYRLAREFGRPHVPVDFVGSHTWPYVAGGFTSATDADPNFDHDHYATGGVLLHSQIGSIQHEVSTQQADIVVLTTGLNVLVHGATAAQNADNLSAFIDRVRLANPAGRIIVSPVLTATTSRGSTQGPRLRQPRHPSRHPRRRSDDVGAEPRSADGRATALRSHTPQGRSLSTAADSISRAATRSGRARGHVGLPG